MKVSGVSQGLSRKQTSGSRKARRRENMELDEGRKGCGVGKGKAGGKEKEKNENRWQEGKGKKEVVETRRGNWGV